MGSRSPELERRCSGPHRYGTAACIDGAEPRRVASSEQVRSPIYRDALERWRNYEPWLGPLISARVPVLDAYLGTPRFGA